MNVRFIGVATLFALSSANSSAADLTESDFFKNSTLNVLNRNFYFDRDFTGDRATQSERREWGQGLIATFNSGFTAGTVGLGVDAIGMYGLKLDSSSDRIGTGLFPNTGSGRPGVDEAQDEYSKGVAALKVKVGKTVLKYGGQMVRNPVFSNSDTRLLPETSEGLTIASRDVPGLLLEAGHLTSLRNREQTDRASGLLQKADFVGGTYDLSKEVNVALYASSVQNYWDKRFFGLGWSHALDANQSVKLQFAGYQTKSIGDELGGDLDNQVYSLKGTYTYLAHSFTLAGQQVTGRGKYAFGVDGADTVLLPQYVQIMDGTREDERSWQARYDLDFATLGVRGLTFMARYVKGDNVKVSAAQNNGKEWERDLQIGYVVQSGPVKGLNTRIRQATYRSDFTASINEVRIITEYPISIF